MNCTNKLPRRLYHVPLVGTSIRYCHFSSTVTNLVTCNQAVYILVNTIIGKGNNKKGTAYYENVQLGAENMMIDNQKIPVEVLGILSELKMRGYESYLVGGAVRDLILGNNPKDFDICTEARPTDVKQIFDKVINTGERFGTVTVLSGRAGIQVTTFRRKSKCGSNQDEEKAEWGNSIKEDVKARDFTVNTLLYDGDQVIDYVDGLKDIQRRTLRAVDKNCGFKDDPLRMMRAVRLHCQLGFDIEKDTLDCIISESELIQSTSPERIRDELLKILTSNVPARGIRLLVKTGLLKYILPELQACYRFDQLNHHHDKDVFDHIMAVVEYTPKDPVLRLAALFHDIGKPKTLTVDEKGIGHFYLHNIVGQKISREVLTRLKFDRKTVEVVGKLVREHMSKLRVIRSKTVRKLINRVGKENIYMLISLQIADEAGHAPPNNFEIIEELKKEVDRILDRNEPLAINDLAVKGEDLIKMGYKPGPEMGKILESLLNKVLEQPELNTRESLMDLVPHPETSDTF